MNNQPDTGQNPDDEMQLLQARLEELKKQNEQKQSAAAETAEVIDDFPSIDVDTEPTHPAPSEGEGVFGKFRKKLESLKGKSDTDEDPKAKVPKAQPAPAQPVMAQAAQPISPALQPPSPSAPQPVVPQPVATQPVHPTTPTAVQSVDPESAQGAGPEMVHSLLAPLTAKLEQIESVLEGIYNSQAPLFQSLSEVLSAMSQQETTATAQAQAIKYDTEMILNGLKQIYEEQQTQEVAEEELPIEEVNIEVQPAQAAPQPSDDSWASVICGEALAMDPSLTGSHHELVNGLLSGDPGAMGFAGQMLLVQSAQPDRIAPLLKDVGEAYYRWRPQMADQEDPFRRALVGWLERKCEEGGVNNPIELVHPGDRFDSTRHNSKKKGMEITEVYGWVVLRDNGKVYTKANVAVK